MEVTSVSRVNDSVSTCVLLLIHWQIYWQKRMKEGWILVREGTNFHFKGYVYDGSYRRRNPNLASLARRTKCRFSNVNPINL